MAEDILDIAQGFVFRRRFRAGLAGDQGGTSLPRREPVGLIGGSALQPEQETAAGAVAPQARQVRLQVAFQTQAQLRRQIAGQRGQTAAAALQANHLVEIFAEDARELQREGRTVNRRDARLVGDGDAQCFHLLGEIGIMDRRLGILPGADPTLQAPQRRRAADPATSNCGASTRGGAQSSHFRKADADVLGERLGLRARLPTYSAATARAGSGARTAPG